MADTELLPCAFCGGPPRYLPHKEGFWSERVICDKCEVVVLPNTWQARAALASRPAEVDEAWVLLFEALPHVSPQAVNWAMARVGPIEEAYIGTRIRKYLERVAAPSHTTNKEK